MGGYDLAPIAKVLEDASRAPKGSLLVFVGVMNLTNEDAHLVQPALPFPQEQGKPEKRRKRRKPVTAEITKNVLAARKESGASYRKIGDVFGISETSVWRILKAAGVA